MPSGVYVRTDEHRAVMKKFYEDPEARERQSAAQNDPEVKARKSAAQKEARNDPEVKLKHKESHVGGFCIQNITYDERKKYCELWNPNLWQRIDACQGNRSIISGKTKEDNGGRALSRHHVYWQEKACCVWDEDAHGYYAMSGTDDYYQSRSDVSREELIALKNLVQVCKDIVELADNDEIVLLHDGEKVNPYDVEDDDNDY